MECYFDNAATTRCSRNAASFVAEALTENYGNPSSLHRKGLEAEKLVRDAAAAIASTLKASPGEIVFTSGGTESNNLALFGAAQAKQRMGKHIITTAVEHAAVLSPAARLKEMGYEVTILPVDTGGCVELDALEDALRQDTILVSVMAVNNEVGTVMPLKEIGQIVHDRSQALFHVDGIQGYGKAVFHPKADGIDLFSVSSHKFHGPKGAGFLYIRDSVRVKPQILGGGQQQGLRSGTYNVPGIAGMAAAAKEACQDLEEKRAYLYRLKNRLVQGLDSLDQVFVNGKPVGEAAPHILDISFVGIRSEVLLHALEDREIYVSAGSACSSHRKKPGGTLAAMGLSPERRESALRFSFSRENTEQEVDYCLSVLYELVPMLRKYKRR